MKLYVRHIIIFSIPINFIWEMAQMPFYQNMPWDLDLSLFCLVASFGDALMILIIFLTVALLVKNKDWLLNLTIRNILLALIIGFIIAVLVEQYALENNMWAYSKIMPYLPIWNIGISPVLQMMILPLIIFKLTKYETVTVSRRK